MDNGTAEQNRVTVFDTTLRDGLYTLGEDLTTEDKVAIAKQLERLGVDVIEVGYPGPNPAEIEGMRQIAKAVRGPIIAALARATTSDIDRAWEALREAEKPRINIYLSSSDAYLKQLFKLSREEALERTRQTVSYAKSFCDDVQFTAHDATRADLDYLCQMIEVAIEAGATTIGLPDTVGHTVPDEFARLITAVRARVKNIEKTVVAVHCHNNLGMAVANSLKALQAGARQVECTIGGIGDKTANASLEEIIMALEARKDFFGLHTGINNDELLNTSQLISNFASIKV